MKKTIHLAIEIETHPEDETRCGRCPYLWIDGDSYPRCLMGNPEEDAKPGYGRSVLCLKATDEPGPHDAGRQYGRKSYSSGSAYDGMNLPDENEHDKTFADAELPLKPGRPCKNCSQPERAHVWTCSCCGAPIVGVDEQNLPTSSCPCGCGLYLLCCSVGA